jgi:hypothetical protein
MASTLKKGLDDTNSHLDVAMDTDPALHSLDMSRREYGGKVLALLAYVDRNMISQKSVRIAPAEYASMIQAALDENFKFFDAVSPSLDQVLEARSNLLRTDKNEVIGLILVLLLAALVLTVWIARSLIVPINQAIQALEAPGGAEISIVSTNRDEISQLIKAATARKPSFTTTPRSVEGPSSDAMQALMSENQDLKSLVAELSLDNRSLKANSAGSSSH